MRMPVDHRMHLLPFLRILWSDPGALHLGVSGTADHLRYVLVAAGPKGKALPLAWGTNIPPVLRCLVPAIARADMGYTPVHLISEAIGNEDPDAWIDRNEARIIPAGFTADRIAADYVVDGSEVVALSAVAASRDGLLDALEKKVTVVSLLPPLAGLAAAYCPAIDGVWILWKIDAQGSVIGRIENGKLRDVCHFWADCEALRDDPQAIVDAVLPLMRSMNGDGPPLRVMCFAAGDPLQVFTGLQLPGCHLFPPPAVPGLPVRYHEAFGNALETGAVPQLLPFHKRQKAEAMLQTWRKAVSAIRFVALLLAVLLLAGGSYIGVGKALVHRDRAAMLDIDKKYNSMQAAAALRDSLARRFRERAAFIGGESSITLLLSDLQEVFPEGVAAEEVTIAERDAVSWNLVIRAIALSSNLMQPVVDNLAGVKGMHDVRMVYSEQVAGKRTKKGIMFKIEAVWR